MDDLDDYEDYAWWFSVRPVRLDEPSPGALWGSVLAIGGLVMLAMAFKRKDVEFGILAGSVIVFGLFRLAMSARSLVAADDALRFRWGRFLVRKLRPSDIQKVTVEYVRGERCFRLHVSGNDHELVMADHPTADWLDQRQVFVPDFDNWRGTHGRESEQREV